MAFGQQAGPPATSRQINELLDLLRAAGHTDFRDARGPMGFTQRQAGGKFTRDEADELITRLRDEADAADEAQAAGGVDAADATDANRSGNGGSSAGRVAPTPRATPVPRQSKTELALTKVPDGLLAAELQRRGWIVVEPS